MKIVVATNNQGKIDEFKALLKDYEVVSLKEAGIDKEVEEVEETFSANSRLKAREIAKLTDEIVLADDSGLLVKSLDDFPGVKTHRFLGDDATDEDRNNYIIDKLKGKEGNERAAEFVTCITAIIDGEEYTVTGVTEGVITKEPRGKNGFGFDPIFETESGKTLAELPKIQKNRASSRRRALNKLIKMKIL